MTSKRLVRLFYTLVVLLSIQEGLYSFEQNYIHSHVGLLTEEQAALILSYHNELALDDTSPVEKNKNTCGLSNRPKIIGGVDAGINEYPWMAFVVSKRANSTFICGGSLITKRHVITAAHCVFNADENGVVVFLGGHQITDPGSTNTIRANVTNYIMHPEYNKTLMANDIAIVILNSTVQFTSKIRPICLPTYIRNYDRLIGTAIGWGRVSSNGTISDTLKKVKVPIVSNAACNKSYNRLTLIQPTMICAGGNGKDVCMGDSGGPLMILDKGRFQIIGIVSFGHGASCGASGFPGVYTRVDHFLPFIRNITNENKDV